MLCRPLVVESEHYAFSPVLRVQGESRGGWGILSALCVLHRLTRGPGRNTQILGPRGNIFQSTPCPRLIENQSPPAPASGPPIEGAPQPVFSIRTLDRSQTRGLRGGKGCPLASPPCSMGFSPVNQPAAPFQGPADRAACCVLDWAAGPGRSPTWDSPKLGPACPGGPVENGLCEPLGPGGVGCGMLGRRRREAACGEAVNTRSSHAGAVSPPALLTRAHTRCPCTCRLSVSTNQV